MLYCNAIHSKLDILNNCSSWQDPTDGRVWVIWRPGEPSGGRVETGSGSQTSTSGSDWWLRDRRMTPVQVMVFKLKCKFSLSNYLFILTKPISLFIFKFYIQSRLTRKLKFISIEYWAAPLFILYVRRVRENSFGWLVGSLLMNELNDTEFLRSSSYSKSSFKVIIDAPPLQRIWMKWSDQAVRCQV